MFRRSLTAALISILLLPCLYANDTAAPTDVEISTALTVIMDCISASLVTECTESNISLPCSNVQMDSETNLPRRIAYFIADPSEYAIALAPKTDTSNGFFASFLALLGNTVENPLVSAVYLALSARAYQLGEYLLSGSITFSYPEGASLDEVLKIWTTRQGTNEQITMIVDMQLFGSKIERPLTVSGTFTMGLASDGFIAIRPVGVYTINGFGFKGGDFRF